MDTSQLSIRGPIVRVKENGADTTNGKMMSPGIQKGHGVKERESAESTEASPAGASQQLQTTWGCGLSPAQGTKRGRSPGAGPHHGRSTIQGAQVTEWHSQCSVQGLGFRVGRFKAYTPAQSSLSFLNLQCGNVYFAGVKPSDGLSETHRRYLIKLQRHPPNQHLLSTQAKTPDKMNWPRVSLLWRRQRPSCFEDPSSFGPQELRVWLHRSLPCPLLSAQMAHASSGKYSQGPSHLRDSFLFSGEQAQDDQRPTPPN